MKTTKNIARLAVTAGLTAALSFGGVMAPVTMAFAEDGDDTITINQVDKNATTKFKAYQIFKADVVDEGGKKVVSNVDWASPAARTAVLGALMAESVPGISDSSTAQDVADYLSENITNTTDTTVVKKDDLLNKIALAVEKDVPATGEAFVAGTHFTAESKGYYLFMTDTSSIGTKYDYADMKQTGTSPIFAVVGGKAVTVTEKTNIPTVEKKVRDDKPGSDWADKADSQMGQNVEYQLTGTVAKNVDTFDTYYYQFYDELSAGLTADVNSVKVNIDGTEINASKFAKNVSEPDANGKTVLTVTFENLKAAGVDITERSQVVVTYTAMLDPGKAVVVSGAGNDNSVKLVYSNNPGHDSKGESVPDTVRDYTYALKLIKEDSADSTKLKDVKFTIKATGADELASGVEGKQFVQKNGSLGGTECVFQTNENGEISVKGLDAGTYTVHEVEDSNPGYNTLPDFTFTISTVKDDGTDSLKQPEGENTLHVTASKSNAALVDEPRFVDGTVILTVKNKKGSSLPLTGLNGVTFTWIAGGAVLCIGVAHLIRSRKRDDGSEE